MRRTGRAGHGRAGADAHRGEPVHHVLQHGVLAPEQVRAAARLDPQAVGAVDGHEGRVAAQHPQGELVQGRGVRVRLGFHDMQAGHPRLRLGDRETGRVAQPLRGEVGVQHQLARAAGAGDHAFFEPIGAPRPSGHLVERPGRQAAGRQPGVDLRQAERQHRRGRPLVSFQLRDAAAQALKHR